MTERMVPARTGDWGVPLALVLLCAVPLAMGAARLVTLAGVAEVLPASVRLAGPPLPVVLHILGGGGFAVLGAFQFAAGFRRRRPGWHRRAGRLAAASGLLAGLSGLWMTLFLSRSDGVHELLTAFRLLFGSAMLVSLALAVAAIRRGAVGQHRAWMMRSYAIGVGAGTQALTQAAGELIAGPPDELGRALLNVAGWVINLAVAEWAIRRQPASPASTAATQPAPHGTGVFSGREA